MLIEHFEGKKECKNLQEIVETLKKKTDKNVNEFIISTDEQFPYIIMAVKGVHACLSYFRNENDCGYSSVNTTPFLDENGISIFYTNTDNEEIEVENTAIIMLDDAIAAVIEFLQTKQLPQNIVWEEL